MSSPWSSALADPDIMLARWRQHALVLLPSLAPAVATATAALALGVSAFLWALTLFFVFRFVWKAVMWWVGWVIVTNRQILRVSGLLIRKREIVPLLYVTTFTEHRTLPGRLLGYGEWVLEAPNHAPMHIRYVPNARENYLLLRRLMAGGEVSRII